METRTSLSHTNVTLRPTPAGRVPHAYIAALSAWGGTSEYGVFSPSHDNAMSALLERVFYHSTGSGFARPSVPEWRDVDATLRGVFDVLKCCCGLSAPVSIREYPGRYYRGPKRQLYERAAATVLRRGFRPVDAYLKSFVKVEKIELKPKRLVPRLIQPRSPEYNVLVGRYIKHLEHPLYLQLNKLWGGPTVMKGLNCFQQAQAMRSAWESFANPVAIMLDAVRFDQHVSAPMLRWEHQVYLSHFRGDHLKELSFLLDRQLENRGAIRTERGTIKYTVQGCRMSGDMNTAMGNCLIMTSCCYAMCRELQIKARLFNNGDDCCLIVESADQARTYAAIKPFFSRMGFIIDVEGSTNIFERISFCQTQPVFDGLLWRMVRDPRKCVSKDTSLVRRWSPKEWYVYWRCLGQCGLSLTHGLPLLQEFYCAMTRFGDEVDATPGLLAHVSGSLRESGMYQLAHGLDPRVSPVSEAARGSFHLAFGISPAVQIEFEEFYSNAGVVPPNLFREPRLSKYL